MGRKESIVSIWARRAVSVPLYLAFTVVLYLGAPVWLLGSAVADAVTGQGRTWPRTRTVCFFGVYLACELVGLLGSTWNWIRYLGGRAGAPGRYLDSAFALQRWWTSSLFNGAVKVFSMKVEVEGLEQVQRGPLLLFVRHVSTADTVLTGAVVTNPRRFNLRYVLKRELLWDPCLDIGGRRCGNVFVDRKASRSRGEIDAIAQLTREMDERSGILIFPEGTRFVAAKLERAVKALQVRKQDRLATIAAGLRHVLPPRRGGPLALLETAPGVDLVLVEHTGFEDAASLASLWRGGLVNRTIRVRIRRFAAGEIPAASRDEWLFERWAEMDRWIGEAAAAA